MIKVNHKFETTRQIINKMMCFILLTIKINDDDIYCRCSAFRAAVLVLATY
mgnify:CR=1 FL=1